MERQQRQALHCGLLCYLLLLGKFINDRLNQLDRIRRSTVGSGPEEDEQESLQR